MILVLSSLKLWCLLYIMISKNSQLRWWDQYTDIIRGAKLTEHGERYVGWTNGHINAKSGPLKLPQPFTYNNPINSKDLKLSLLQSWALNNKEVDKTQSHHLRSWVNLKYVESIHIPPLLCGNGVPLVSTDSAWVNIVIEDVGLHLSKERRWSTKFENLYW